MNDGTGTGDTDDHYDPGRDAALRYPDWVVRHRPLYGIPELLDYRRRVILIDSGQTRNQRRSCLAHAIAHLDLGHHHIPNAQFETIQEREADQLAATRLIRFDRLLNAALWATSWTELADELTVDQPTVRTRLDTLTPHEEQALKGKLHARDLDVA